MLFHFSCSITNYFVYYLGIPFLTVIPLFSSGVSPGAGRSQPVPDQDQAGPDLLQAPPAADHEGPLPDQPEPGLQGAQDALPEDRPRQEGLAGEDNVYKQITSSGLFDS